MKKGAHGYPAVGSLVLSGVEMGLEDDGGGGVGAGLGAGKRVRRNGWGEGMRVVRGSRRGSCIGGR